MNLLRPGISCDRRMPFANFKAASYEAARVMRGTVSSIRSPKVTPNYFSATLDGDSDKTIVLGNIAYPVVAFARDTDGQQWHHDFIDLPHVADIFHSHGYECPDAAELSTIASSADLKVLRDTELKDIEYWKPETIGEIVFNHWD